MKKYYSTIVQELGAQVHAFKDARMLILFNENAPQELREYCVLQTDYKIVYVGSQVQKNLRDLGHITLRFNANEEGENLEGSLYLENKEVGDIEPGEEIAIYKP